MSGFGLHFPLGLIPAKAGIHSRFNSAWPRQVQGMGGWALDPGFRRDDTGERSSPAVTNGACGGRSHP